MSITSFYFLALVTLGVLVYYIVPKSIQWMILLVLSAVFYYFAATPYTIGYPCGFHNDSLFVYNVDSEKKGCIRKRSKGVIGCYICGIGSQYSNLVLRKGTWIVGAVCIEADRMA